MWSWALTWGCIPELSGSCIDMTNSSSTYLGIIASAKQDYTLNRIEQLENYNEKLLEKIKVLEEKMKNY